MASSYRTCSLSVQNDDAVCTSPTSFFFSLMSNDSDYVEVSDWDDNNFNTSNNPTFDDFNKMGITARVVYFVFVNILTHCTLIGITWTLSRKCFELGLEQTAEHAYYSTLAFVLLIGECILMHAPYNPLSCLLSKFSIIIIHMLLALAALVFGIYGVGVKYWQKELKRRAKKKREEEEEEEHSKVDDLNSLNNNQKRKKQGTIQHFRTKHGFYGIIGPVIFFLTIILGFITFFMFDVKFVKSLHRIMAILSFLLLSIAQYTGYNTGFARRNLSEKNIKLYKCFTIILLYTTLNYSFRKMLHDFSLSIPQFICDFLGLTS